MIVENTSWTINTLHTKISIITKPKFQRDKRWLILPHKNKKKPNYKDYMRFLIKNKNSVFPISLGTEIVNSEEKFIVIDGNNRINALITFLNTPYKLFPEYYEKLFNLLSNYDIDAEKCIYFFKNLDYKTISCFRRLNDIIPNDIKLVIGDSNLFGVVEDALVDIQNNFLIDGKTYDTNIVLSMNIFKGGSYKQYCKIFEDINKHSSSLSENELLSAILFNTQIYINDSDLQYQISHKIIDFYKNRGCDEVLQHYEIEDVNDFSINAFDFIVGFQNYCNERYYVIPKFDTSGLSLFFKLFKIIYGDIDSNLFTDENIADFCFKIVFACDILSKSYEKIFPLNINENLFSKNAVSTSKLLKKNNMTIIFTTIIASKNQYDQNTLINNIRISVIYHLLTNARYLKHIDKEHLTILKHIDKIEYIAGGKYIECICYRIYHKNEYSLIFNEINKNRFTELIQICIRSLVKEKTYDEVRKNKKRRKLNLVDKVLLCNYWNRNMPNKFIKKNYSIEHITPFSSQWEDNISIDRLGNLFPTLDKINKKRSNKNLEIYSKKYPNFTENIKDLLPLEQYANINKLEKRKTSIINNKLYNEYCLNNEEIYINNLINELYPIHL